MPLKKLRLLFAVTFLCFLTLALFSCTNPLFEQVLGLKTITFNTNGGSHVPEQKLFKGEKITRPKDPVKVHLLFSGWYLDKETLQHEWNFNIAPDRDMMLYAKWSVGSIVVEVYPATVSVQRGDTYQFSANVFNSSNQNVIWYVGGALHDGTFINSETGELTVSQDETSTQLTVRAVFADDETISGMAIVTIVASGSLTGSASITGTPIVGQIMTADTSALEGTGEIDYQWQRSGDNVTYNDISGAVSSTYELAEEDDDHFIRVRLGRAGISGNVFSAAVKVEVQQQQYTLTFELQTGILTPINPLSVNVIGLRDGDTPVYAGVSISTAGFTFENGAIKYDGSGTFTGNTASVQFAVSNSKYIVESPTSVSIRDGKDPARAIPVNETNIENFNIYAGTVPGISQHYVQTGDITLNGNWTPIGGEGADGFSGTYDGGGKVIAGLKFSSGDNLGMFHSLSSNSEVRNLGLIGVEISGTGNNIGGLAGGIGGGAKAVVIENCYVIGSVTATGNYIGGLVGNVGYVTIKNSYFSGSVNGGNQTGGLAGNITGNQTGHSTIVNSYFSGSVNGGNQTGGLVGNASGIVKIENSYVIGDIKGTGSMAGGVVGQMAFNTSSYVKNCYAAGNVIGTLNVGGIVGGFSGATTTNTIIADCISFNQSVKATNSTANIGRIVGSTNGTLSNNYVWKNMDVRTGVTADGSGGNYKNIVHATAPALADGIDGWGISADEVKSKETWEDSDPDGLGFKFGTSADDPWVWNNNTNMPSLDGVGSAQTWPAWLVDPDGSAAAPFLVTTATLQYVGRGTNNSNASYYSWMDEAHYRLVENINLEGAQWTPIPAFDGTFDGNGHTISNFTINSNNSNVGFFTSVIVSGGNIGTVKNLGLKGISITGNVSSVGGIAGRNTGIIENCFVEGNISGNKDVGGIVGANTGTVRNCYVIGTVSGTVDNALNIGVGGIAGDTFAGTVQNCVALLESIESRSTADQYLGRIAGYGSTGGSNYAWSGMIVKNSNNELTITGTAATSIHGADITSSTITAAQACLAVFGDKAPDLTDYLD